jgi:hypothetical protein
VIDRATGGDRIHTEGTTRVIREGGPSIVVICVRCSSLVGLAENYTVPEHSGKGRCSEGKLIRKLSVYKFVVVLSHKT